MMRWVFGVLAVSLAGASTVMVPSCAAVVSSLPLVIAAVTDGMLVLDSLKPFVDAYFKNRPNEDLEKKVATASARARGALNAALRIAQATDKLNQAKVDEAFADFRVAYSDLLVLLGPLGVQQQGDRLRATPGGMIVPEPLALKLKI